MPIITFQPSGRTVEVASGTLLFDAVQRAGLPIASSCSSAFVCGKCNLAVSVGCENLSPQRDAEKNLLMRERKPVEQRISCVARVYGDCTVRASYW